MWVGRVLDSMTSSTEHHQVRAKIRRQFQNKKGIKAAIKRDNPSVEDLTTVPRWARVTELNHAITNAKIDASRLLAQEIVATAVAYDNCLIMMEDLSWSGDWWGEPYGVLLHWVELRGVRWVTCDESEPGVDFDVLLGLWCGVQTQESRGE